MERLLFEPLWKTFFRVLGRAGLRRAALSCAGAALRFFFLPQYRAALFPGHIPVSRVDHPLDQRIPFNPRWVLVYLDFVAFWIRLAGWMLVYYGNGGEAAAAGFITSIKGLYLFAARIYGKNLSTTKRPRYLKNVRFLMIHVFDPHLMCIPSLHVMIVIRSYTAFRDILAKTPIPVRAGGENTAGEKELLMREAENVFRGALDITQAVLYVKQHSVNCVSAAMYTMSRFDPALFPPEEAERFTKGLFSPGGASPGGGELSPDDIPLIRTHIIELYRSFIKEGENCEDWTRPLLLFLERLPRVIPF